VQSCKIENSTLDGDVNFVDCDIEDCTYLNGHIESCGLMGTITLGGTRESVFTNCYTPDQDNPPTINMGGTGNDLAMPNYAGLITVTNLSDSTSEIGIGLLAGAVTLDSTITAGTVIVSGVGVCQDNSTADSVDVSALLSTTSIASSVWAYTR
jgi:hypothetical protein